MNKKFPFPALLAFILLFFAACTKIVSTDIGGNLLPPIDGVNTKEMYLDVSTKNWGDTSVGIGRGTINALGYVNDPIFGKTQATINVEIKPSYYPVVFPVGKDSLAIDSIVLVLGYTGAWGDTIGNMNLRVFEEQNINPDTDLLRSDIIYPSTYNPVAGRELTYNNTPANINITKLNDVDTLSAFQEPATNQVRIRLADSYGTELLKNYDTSVTYHDDSLFERTFKGYKIQAQSTAGLGALLRINLLDTNTKIAIYYNYIYPVVDSGGKITHAVKYFHTNSYNCGSSDYVTRDRSGTAIPTYLPKNTAKSDDLLFIDASPGIYSHVNISGLDTLSNKIIHRAELLMEQVPGDAASDALFTPPNLFLAPMASEDTGHLFYFPNDVTVSSGVIVNQGDFGSAPIKKIDPATQQTIYRYSFDISRYVQGIISKHDPVYPLALFAPSNDYVYLSATSPYVIFTGTTSGPLNTPAIGRIRLGGGVLGGGVPTDHTMRLHIVYSEVK